jgi:hypothetical protein
VITTPLDDHGSFSWLAHPDEPLRRSGTALAVAGGSLLIDPVDAPGLDEAVAPLGRVIGVVKLIDRHERDAHAVADRLGAPRLYPGVLAGQGPALALPEVQERVVLAAPGWNESALWLPDRALLVVAEALGTADFFLTHPSDRLGVHPILRVRPPRRALDVTPTAIAVSHGQPVVTDAAAALRDALAGARTGLPILAGRLALSARRSRRP